MGNVTEKNVLIFPAPSTFAACKRKAVHQATAYYQKLLISLVYDEAIKR